MLVEVVVCVVASGVPDAFGASLVVDVSVVVVASFFWQPAVRAAAPRIRKPARVRVFFMMPPQKMRPFGSRDSLCNNRALLGGSVWDGVGRTCEGIESKRTPAARGGTAGGKKERRLLRVLLVGVLVVIARRLLALVALVALRRFLRRTAALALAGFRLRARLRELVGLRLVVLF